MKNTGLKSTWTNPTLYIYSNIINLKHFPKDFCQIFCNGDGPAWTSHPVATLLRLWKDGSWHHQHQWRTMRRMLLRLRKDGYRHHPHHRLKFSMGFLGRGFYASTFPRVIMERHRRFTLSSPLSCNTGLVFCNDAPLSLQHSLQALSSSVPTPWLMASSQKNSSNNCWCSSINSFRKEVSSIDLGGGCRG